MTKEERRQLEKNRQAIRDIFERRGAETWPHQMYQRCPHRVVHVLVSQEKPADRPCPKCLAEQGGET